MSEERLQSTGRELVRWMVVAAFIIAGLALYFREARHTHPVVHPGGQETVP